MQLPLDLRWRGDLRLSEFVFADAANLEIARSALTGVAPLLIIGPSGAGKSVLLKALAQELDGSCKVINLADQNALPHNKPQIAQLFDNIDCASSALQLELFHSFNQAHDARLPWIASAAMRPEKLALLPDLVSRLQQCVQLNLPRINDEHQRRLILLQQATRYGFNLDDRILDYLDVHVARDVSALSRVLQLLHELSLSRQKKPSLHELRQLLKQGLES